MKFVLIHLKDSLSQMDLEKAEDRARACGITLDEWLVTVLKAAIRNPEQPPAIHVQRLLQENSIEE